MPPRLSQETTEREMESVISILLTVWGQRIYFKNQFKKRRGEKKKKNGETKIKWKYKFKYISTAIIPYAN